MNAHDYLKELDDYNDSAKLGVKSGGKNYAVRSIATTQSVLWLVLEPIESFGVETLALTVNDMLDYTSNFHVRDVQLKFICGDSQIMFPEQDESYLCGEYGFAALSC